MALPTSVRVVWSGVVLSVAVATLSGAQSRPDSAAAETTGPIFDEEGVDVPVGVVRMTRPIFPSALRDRNICGYADVTYVVGTNGLAELWSLAVLTVSDSSFGAAALDAIATSRFKPAVRRGAIVRQRVRQRVTFMIDGADPDCRLRASRTPPLGPRVAQLAAS